MRRIRCQRFFTQLIMIPASIMYRIGDADEHLAVLPGLTSHISTVDRLSADKLKQR